MLDGASIVRLTVSTGQIDESRVGPFLLLPLVKSPLAFQHMSEETNTSKNLFESAYKLIDRYAIRYTVSTVVGTVVVAALVREYAGAEFKWTEVGKTEHTGILIALGFTWCFVASAPIYALHATRSLFVPQSKESTRNNWIGLGVLFGLGGLLAYFFGWKLDSGWFESITMAGFIAAWLCQILAVFYALFQRDHIYSWHKALSLRRSGPTNDFVESYRTLREFGNAYQIIVLEIALGLIVAGLFRAPATSAWFKTDPFSALGITLAAWISPGYFAYGIAHRLEADFQADK